MWADALDFYEKAQANGLIESYEIKVFLPSGGALPIGMITLWGSEDQVDALSRNEDRVALQMRAALWSRTSSRAERCVVPRPSRASATFRRPSTASRSHVC